MRGALRARMGWLGCASGCVEQQGNSSSANTQSRPWRAGGDEGAGGAGGVSVAGRTPTSSASGSIRAPRGGEGRGRSGHGDDSGHKVAFDKFLSVPSLFRLLFMISVLLGSYFLRSGQK